MAFFEELKRRNVVKVAVLYVVAAWLILQVGDVLFDNLGAPEWAFRMVLGLLVLFFFPALLFSWIYELTPEGLQRDENVDRARFPVSQTGHKINLLIVVLLVLAIGAVVLDRFIPRAGEAVATQASSAPAGQPAARPAAEPPGAPDTARAPSVAAPIAAPPPRSIAVLPFVNMSGDVENEYFADGLSEEILNFLAGVPDLQVTARTSSFQFKGRNEDVREIGEALNVANVLEGSVRRAGDQARITAQLIRASDGYHLWSETYDRRLDDVFEVQTGIADSVTRALGIVLDDAQRQRMVDAGVRDVEAFIAYQRGLGKFWEAHGQDIDMVLLADAAADFTRAVEREPGFANAYFMRSDYEAHLMSLAETDEAARQTAFAAYGKDLELASRHARNPAQRALIEVDRGLAAGSWSSLPARLRAAVVVPGCEMGVWVEVAPLFGFADEYHARVQRMIACDPLNPYHYYDAARSALWARRPDAALRWAEAGLERSPEEANLQAIAVTALLAQGNLEEAAQRAQALTSRYRNIALAVVAAATGEVEEARSLAQAVIESASPGLRTTFDVNMNAIVGNRAAANEAAAWLDRLPSGSLLLASATMECMCGAPFDLEATPVFRQRLEEAGVSWPPPAVVPALASGTREVP
jgi:TolB-like protein